MCRYKITGCDYVYVNRMGAYYQLIFLGETSCDACHSIRHRFFELLEERGFEASMISVLDGNRVLLKREEGGYDPAKPSFAFYFGSKEHNDRDIDAVAMLKGNADAIYPIHFYEGAFQEEIPELLHPFNGSLYEEQRLDSIVNVAFEELRLLRKTRRVFISYKRSDSATVANQLFDVLSRAQFDVFLDTYSIRGAADFQQELKHRITDSDVLIQLNSPSFMDSDWCIKEISEANARQVGVLQLNWPGVSQGDKNELCTSLSLLDVDFRHKRYKRATSTLKTKVLSKIVSHVEAVRARNLAARHDSLTAEFVKEANRQGRVIIKEPSFLVEQKANGKFWIYIPAIGVPQSINFHDSVKMLDRWEIKDSERVFLIYDDISILPQWIEHLDWMSQYLEVKTIKKQDFASWLHNS